MLDIQKCCLVVVDVQGKLAQLMYDKQALFKNIIGKRADGTEIKTAYMDWIAKTETFNTNAKVLITRKNIRLTGHGLRADPGFKTMHIKKFPVMEIRR